MPTKNVELRQRDDTNFNNQLLYIKTHWLNIVGKPNIVLDDDSRLTDARTPLAHNQAWSTITSTPTTIAGYGITDNLIYDNDARLSDARTPLAHDQAWSTITSPPATATRWPTHAEVTSKPATATRWPTWSEVTSKPTDLPVSYQDTCPGANYTGGGKKIVITSTECSTKYTGYIYMVKD